MAEIQFDISEYMNKALMEMQISIDKKIEGYFKEAFEAGADRGYAEGMYEGSGLEDPVEAATFEEWMAAFKKRMQE